MMLKIGTYCLEIIQNVLAQLTIEENVMDIEIAQPKVTEGLFW